MMVNCIIKVTFYSQHVLTYMFKAFFFLLSFTAFSAGQDFGGLSYILEAEGKYELVQLFHLAPFEFM